MVSGRIALRAGNDNRRSRSPGFWPWALAAGIAPTISVMLLLSMLF